MLNQFGKENRFFHAGPQPEKPMPKIYFYLFSHSNQNSASSKELLNIYPKSTDRYTLSTAIYSSVTDGKFKRIGIKSPWDIEAT